uniref:N-glycosylase/DNA lyase n=1 Tax=Strigamia maritima TaxID=126957 RepID=T1IY70_STRMM
MWKSMPLFSCQLNLEITLSCGQSFRWKKLEDSRWIGVLGNCIWTLKQSGDELMYTVQYPDKTTTKIDENQCKEQLSNYFQLEIDLKEKYSEWCAADKHFKKVASLFHGVRMLRQDPVETLFAFICSSNNNIPRITSMVEKLCTNYGNYIGEFEGDKYYSFPTITSLSAPGVEETLRKLSFGYRAKYIAQTAKYIESQSEKDQWLYKLKWVSYETAFKELQKLPGVGAKVADCICLMALDKSDAIPVDTHVYQIAKQNYLPHLKPKKSLNASMYKEVGDCFRNIFGPYSGWAHSSLKSFQTH